MNEIPRLPGVFAVHIGSDYFGSALDNWHYFPSAKLASLYAGYHSNALSKAFCETKRRTGAKGIASLGGVLWLTAQSAFTTLFWEDSQNHLRRVFPFLRNAQRAPVTAMPRNPATVALSGLVKAASQRR